MKYEREIRDFPGSQVVKTSSSAGDAGSIPGQGTKIPHAMQQGQKINKNILKKKRKGED